MSSNASSGASEDANATNLAIASETNRINQQNFRESRGSTGSAILPTYLSQYEKQLGENAANLALDAYSPENMAGYYADAASLRPAAQGGTAAVNDLLSGATLQNRLGSLAPVAEARVNQAQTRQQAIDQSLKETIGRLNATMAQRGFTGGSSFDNRRLLGSTIDARQGAANEMSNALLTNAQDTATVRDSDIAARLSSLGLIGQQANTLAALRGFPTTAAAAQLNSAQLPLSMFNIGTSAWQASPLPAVNPVMSSTGNFGAAIAGAGQSLGNYFAMQQAANQMNKSGGYSYSSPDTGLAKGDAAYADYVRQYGGGGG